jgi:serine phosphatase RsbU (regulator of sigma subunit)/anti-sigma regulatory factor (Ser/Thr protein kinase)
MPDPPTAPDTRAEGITLTLETGCHYAAVREAGLALKEWLGPWGVNANDRDGLMLATVEAGNNAVEHAEAAGRDLPLRFDFCLRADWVEIRVTDHTPGFDWPAEVDLPDPSSEGGRGLFLIRALTDEAAYFRGPNQNLLVMRKRRPPGAPPPGKAESAFAAKLGETEVALEAMTAELSSTYESLTALFRYSAELGRGADGRELAGRLVSDLLQITQADAVLLRLASPDGRRLEPFLGWPDGPKPAGGDAGSPQGLDLLAVPDSAPIAAEVQAAQTRQDVWFGPDHPLEASDPLRRRAGLQCGLCHPFFAANQLIGTAVLGRRAAAPGFTAAQVNLLHTFTDFLGIHVASARAQEQRTRIRLLERELQIAADIQRSLLPATLPSCPPFALAASCLSAREVGGDFYDVVAVGADVPSPASAAAAAAGIPGPAPDGLLLVIADVMGKGVPAALFAAMLRNAIRSMPHLFSHPGHLLETVNRTLFADLSRVDMFATAKAVFADRAHRVLISASAGHSPLLLASPGQPPQPADDSGLPLGIDFRTTYAEHRIRLRPDDVALLYTDGVTEARDPSGAMFGEQRLTDWLAEATRPRPTVESLKASLLRRLSDFCAGASAADDQTFVLLHHTR